jgi:hypothetical protein
VHAAGRRVVCELHDRDDLVRIAVRDEGCAPGEPHPSPRQPEEEHGRGLLLVEAMCRAWGAQDAGPGLLVWADLPRRVVPAQRSADTAARSDLGWSAKKPPSEDRGSGAEASCKAGTVGVPPAERSRERGSV